MKLRSPFNVSGEYEEEILGERARVLRRAEQVLNDARGREGTSERNSTSAIPLVASGIVDAIHLGHHGTAAGDKTIGSVRMSDALDRTQVSADHLASNNPDLATLAASKAMGGAFEIEVNNSLVNGSLHAPTGTARVEQLSFTHPGADFRFLDDHDHVIALMNTKASSSYQIIAEHFQRYPDVNYVYATHDAAVAAAQHGYTVVDGVHHAVPLVHTPIVVDAGTSSAEYQQAIQNLADSQHHHFPGLSHDHNILLDIPWLSLAVVSYRAYKRRNAGMDFAENRKNILRDTGISGGSIGVSRVLQHIGVPVPVTITASLFTAAAMSGLYEVRDQWSFLGEYDEMLASRLETMSRT